MATLDDFKTASPLHQVEALEAGAGFSILPIDTSATALEKFQKIVVAAIGMVGNEYAVESVPAENGWIEKVTFRLITY
ncbi:hypothetical protein [Methylobacillus glycogenes]|uniref:hypothetical protein n=1 Tax=Methylobacillus glycogenes TaxID=406 RepID=UPI0004706005|nr:hypothetical protein [Methylobacillus glycogenes]MBL8504835.1 hypothetical protein [Methylobacillus glycogenes]